MRHTDRGFTLIELLTVIAILGVLSALAIPAYSNFQRKAFDGRAIHDLANATIAEEAHYVTNEVYVSFSAVGPVKIGVPGLVVSDTITLEVVAAGQSYTATSTSSKGTGIVFTYDSTGGVIQP
jgi:prepilin-type N-terminal cleavage/methylation domain-containing protein